MHQKATLHREESKIANASEEDEPEWSRHLKREGEREDNDGMMKSARTLAVRINSLLLYN